MTDPSVPGPPDDRPAEILAVRFGKVAAPPPQPSGNGKKPLNDLVMDTDRFVNLIQLAYEGIELRGRSVAREFDPLNEEMEAEVMYYVYGMAKSQGYDVPDSQPVASADEILRLLEVVIAGREQQFLK